MSRERAGMLARWQDGYAGDSEESGRRREVSSEGTKELTEAASRRCGARAEQACLLCRAARREGPTALIAKPDRIFP